MQNNNVSFYIMGYTQMIKFPYLKLDIVNYNQIYTFVIFMYFRIKFISHWVFTVRYIIENMRDLFLQIFWNFKYVLNLFK